MPPTAAWSQGTLGQMLADHPDKLSEESNGLHHSVKRGWTGPINHVEGGKGFKHPDKNLLRYISQAFLTKEEAQVDALAEEFTKIIEAGEGAVKKTEYWGLKSLAYKIKKNRKAHFVMLNIDAPPAAVEETAEAKEPDAPSEAEGEPRREAP